jgi:hypothetical protein
VCSPSRHLGLLLSRCTEGQWTGLHCAILPGGYFHPTVDSYLQYLIIVYYHCDLQRLPPRTALQEPVIAVASFCAGGSEAVGGGRHVTSGLGDTLHPGTETLNSIRMTKRENSSEKSEDSDHVSPRSGRELDDTMSATTAQQSLSSFISTSTGVLVTAGPDDLDVIPEVVKEDVLVGGVGGLSESVIAASAATEAPVDAWSPERPRRSSDCGGNSSGWMLLPQVYPAATTAATSDQNPPQQQQVLQECASGGAESASEVCSA